MVTCAYKLRNTKGCGQGSIRIMDRMKHQINWRDLSVPGAYTPQLAVANYYLNAGGYYQGPLYGSHCHFKPLQ